MDSHVTPFSAYFAQIHIKTGLRDSPNLRSENDIDMACIWQENPVKTEVHDSLYVNFILKLSSGVRVKT